MRSTHRCWLRCVAGGLLLCWLLGCSKQGFDLEFNMKAVVPDIELTIDASNGVAPIDLGNNTYRIDLDESGRASIPDTWPIASFHRTFINTLEGRMVQLEDFRIEESDWEMAYKNERTANGVRSSSIKEGSKYRMRIKWLNSSVKPEVPVSDDTSAATVDEAEQKKF